MLCNLKGLIRKERKNLLFEHQHSPPPPFYISRYLYLSPPPPPPNRMQGEKSSNNNNNHIMKLWWVFMHVAPHRRCSSASSIRLTLPNELYIYIYILIFTPEYSWPSRLQCLTGWLTAASHTWFNDYEIIPEAKMIIIRDYVQVHDTSTMIMKLWSYASYIIMFCCP